MKRKLQSDNGASIIFALLIFLLCGVVASVILGAATAASGRLSGTTEMDQRYYAVTSAAELFREMVTEEGTVTVVRTKTTETRTESRYINTVDGMVQEGEPAVTETTVFRGSLNGVSVLDGVETTLLEKLALYMVFGVDRGIGEVVLNNTWPLEVFDGANERSFTLEMKLEGAQLEADTLDALAVNVSGRLKADGTLELIFSNANGTDKYALMLTFAADVEQSSFEKIDEKEPDILRDEESGTITEMMVTTVTETKVAEIRWVMTDMKKVVSAHEMP